MKAKVTWTSVKNVEFCSIWEAKTSIDFLLITYCSFFPPLLGLVFKDPNYIHDIFKKIKQN